MSELGKQLGGRIRQLRTQRATRWTQEDLAERARISVSFLSMIERGERVAHVETLASLAAALEVTLSDLFDQIPAADPASPVDPAHKLRSFLREHPLSGDDVEKLLEQGRQLVAASAARPTGT